MTQTSGFAHRGLAALFATALVLLPLALPVRAQAADDDGRKAALELMELTNVEQTLSMVRGQIDQTMAAQIKTIQVPERMQGMVVDYQKKISALVFKELSFSSMKEEYVSAYTSVFSTAELDGLVEFYKTPVGKAFVEKQPQLSQKLIGLAQTRMEKIAPEVQKLNDVLLAQIKKEGEKSKK